MRSLPCVVATVKSIARSSVTWTPALPSDVGALGVLAEERPVDALLGHAHRPHVGEEVQLAAHRHVRALDVRPGVALARRGRRALEDDVALPSARRGRRPGSPCRRRRGSRSSAPRSCGRRPCRSPPPAPAGAASTRSACAVMYGPMPSPPQTPMTIGCSEA